MEIIFYQTASGHNPVQDFIDSLPEKAKRKVATRIEMLKTMGAGLTRPYTDDLRKGIRELRAGIAGDEYRVLYFFIVGDKAILTNGFLKKQDTVPVQKLIWR